MMKQGDILYCRWGYDQTNIDWYQVDKRSGDWVTLQQVGETLTYDNATMTGKTLPNPSEKIGKAFRRRVFPYYGEELVKIKSYSQGYEWDGSPKHYSSYG